MNWLTRTFYAVIARTVISAEARRFSGRRSYAAASQVARFGDFNKSPLSANSELDAVLATLRNRSRSLYRNDPFVRRWVRQVETNVVGDGGFIFRSRAKNANGGMDKFGNDLIESAWVDWAEACTSDGQMSFPEACAMATRTWCRDGEVMVEFVRDISFTHGFAIRFLEADMLDETLNKQKPLIRQGVELDKFERPIAYHFLIDHPGESYLGMVNYRKHRRIPADQILHIYLKDRPHQVRGEPPMVAIMTATKMLSGYREAEVTGRRLAASKMGFFKRLFSQGEGDIAPLADTELEDGTLEMDVEPGVLRSLPPGVDFEKFDMSTFSTDYEQFERQIMRSISAGLDIAYANITMDSSNSSYSADRSDQIKQRDVWRSMQMFFIRQMANKIRNHWIDIVFGERYIALPPQRVDKFRKGSYFTPRGWSWVDPQKEITAALEARSGGLTSLTHIAAEQGRDLEDVFNEIKAENDLAASMGIDLTVDKKKPVDQKAETE